MDQNTDNIKVSKKDFALMLVVAIFFDTTLALIQLIFIIGFISATVFNVLPLMLFFIWYRLKGISFAKPKNAISFFGIALFEFIPILNVLPGWTAEVIYMYALQNKEKILSQATGALGAVGGASLANATARTIGGGSVGNGLNKTVSMRGGNEVRSSIKPLQNPINKTLGSNIQNSTSPNPKTLSNQKNKTLGSSIQQNIQQDNKLNNIVPFSNKTVGSEIQRPPLQDNKPSNIVPFPNKDNAIVNSNDKQTHDSKWIFPNKKAS